MKTLFNVKLNYYSCFLCYYDTSYNVNNQNLHRSLQKGLDFELQSIIIVLIVLKIVIPKIGTGATRALLYHGFL